MTINAVQASSKAFFLDFFEQKFFQDPQRAMKAKLAIEGIFSGVAELAALGHEISVADTTAQNIEQVVVQEQVEEAQAQAQVKAPAPALTSIDMADAGVQHAVDEPV